MLTFLADFPNAGLGQVPEYSVVELFEEPESPLGQFVRIEPDEALARRLSSPLRTRQHTDPRFRGYWCSNPLLVPDYDERECFVLYAEPAGWGVVDASGTQVGPSYETRAEAEAAARRLLPRRAIDPSADGSSGPSAPPAYTIADAGTRLSGMSTGEKVALGMVGLAAVALIFRGRR